MKVKKFLINSKNLLIIVALLVMVITYSSFLNPSLTCNSPMPVIKNGFMDATNWCLVNDKNTLLRGEWEFYGNQLIQPGEFSSGNNNKEYVTIPTELSSKTLLQNGENFKGYGTLRMHVRLKGLRPDRLYAISAVYLASSSRIWIDGIERSSTGVVSTQAKDYKAQYLPKESFFYTKSQDVEIVIQFSNYHHSQSRLGNIWFGTAENIIHYSYINIIKSSVIVGALFVISIIYFIMYMINRHEKSSLWFSLSAFFVAVRALITGDRILIRMIPDFSPEFMMKLGYLSALLVLPLFVLYLRDIFGTTHLKNIAKLCKYSMYVSTIIVLVSDVKLYAFLFRYAQWGMLIIGSYVIYHFYVNGLFQKTEGSYTILVGILLLLLAAINDMLREMNLIDASEMLSTAMVLFITLQAIYLGWKLQTSYMKAKLIAYDNEKMYIEIQEMNHNLEESVYRRTKDLEAANKKLEMLSLTDPLTELANRRCFRERINDLWQRSEKEQKPLIMIIIDIDYFKAFNDTYGHTAGDECLQVISDEMKNCIRPGRDLVTRYGGEEFTVLLWDLDLSSGMYIAEQIRYSIQMLQIPHKTSLVSAYVTVSIGLSGMIASQDTNIDEFINKADSALYRGKENGRNRVEQDKSMYPML